MVNGYCWEVENTKGKHRCKMGEFMERENSVACRGAATSF